MKHIVYLDHAATSWPKPPSVLNAMKEAVMRDGGNPGRSGHQLSMGAADVVYTAREAVAQLVGIHEPERVTFTQNATYALNMAIKGAVRAPCHILLSDMEHNATLRPIHALKELYGIEYSTFATEGDVEANICAAIRPDTRMLVSTLSSNICGREIPLSVLSRIRHAYGLYTVVDASQHIGHAPIDLSRHGVDVLCAPAHKGLFGAMGCGFAVYADAPSHTHMEGGSGNESRAASMPQRLPERMEAGTLPVPAIASLTAGISYILEIGEENIRQKLRSITELLSCELSRNKDVHIVDSARHGILSFTCASIAPEELARRLDAHGICVRAGLHCAPLAHRTLGTQENGTVRLSVAHTTTEEDIHALLTALHTIVR